MTRRTTQEGEEEVSVKRNQDIPGRWDAIDDETGVTFAWGWSKAQAEAFDADNKYINSLAPRPAPPTGER